MFKCANPKNTTEHNQLKGREREKSTKKTAWTVRKEKEKGEEGRTTRERRRRGEWLLFWNIIIFSYNKGGRLPDSLAQFDSALVSCPVIGILFYTFDLCFDNAFLSLLLLLLWLLDCFYVFILLVCASKYLMAFSVWRIIEQYNNGTRKNKNRYFTVQLLTILWKCGVRKKWKFDFLNSLP